MKLNFSFIKKINWKELPKLKSLRHDAVLAVLSYLHVLVLIPFIFGKKDQFVRYHSRQGFLLLVFWVLFGFSLFVPYLPWLFLVAIVVLMISGLLNVILGKKKPMILIGKYAEEASI